MDKIRWGIMSAAKIARRRAMPFLAGGQVDNGLLYAVASRSDIYKAEIQEKFSPEKYYDNFDELIDDPNVDAIYNPLLNPEHHEWTIKALRAGKPVLCEKPMAMNMAELDEMIAVSKETKIPLMEAFACYHSPLYGKVREIIQSGEIGAPRMIDTCFHFNSFLANSGAEGNRVLEKSLGGSAMLDLGCYTVLNIRAISGKEPIKTSALGLLSDEGVDIAACAHMDMGDGLFANMEIGINAARKIGISILGETGYISFDRSPNAWGDLSINLNTMKNGKKEINFYTKPPYALEMEQFGRCVAEGEKPAFSLENSRQNMLAMTEVIKQLRGSEY